MRNLILFTGVLAATLASIAAGYLLYQHFHPRPDEVGTPAPVAAVQKNPGPAFNRELEGTVRPDFSLPDINGEIRNVSEWDGQVVALNFWATWCPPCLREIPEFVSLQEKYSDRGLQFVGVALQAAEDVTDFVQSHGMNYPVLVGELDVIELANAYGNEMGTLPYTVIIGRDKRISFIKLGQLDADKAEEIITSLL